MPPILSMGQKSMKFRFLWTTDSIKVLSILGRLTGEMGAAWLALPFQPVLTPWTITSSDPLLEPPASCVFSSPWLSMSSQLSLLFSCPCMLLGLGREELRKHRFGNIVGLQTCMPSTWEKETGKWGRFEVILSYWVEIETDLHCMRPCLKKPKDHSEPRNPIFWRLEAGWHPSG